MKCVLNWTEAPRVLRYMWTVIKTAANDWLRHHDARLGAALAYYSVFSLGPLLLIVVSVAGFFFGGRHGA